MSSNLNTNDIQEEIEHLKELRSICTKRRRLLEKQQAIYGLAAVPAHISIELDTVNKDIDKISDYLTQLGENPLIYFSSNLLERLSKLEQTVSQITQHIADSLPKVSSTIISSDFSSQSPFIGILEVLEDAIRGQRTVTIIYRSIGQKKSSQRIIQPLSLELISNNWYLQASLINMDAKRMYRVDRIDNVDNNYKSQ